MTHGRRVATAAVVAVAVVAFLTALQARALPRYGARYEQKCALCHVNPTGGGARTAYASQRLVPEELAMSAQKPELLKAIDPMIAKQILVGTDFRELWLGSDSEVAGERDFFQMQADLYFDFQLDPRVHLYYDRGMSNAYELFGYWYPVPLGYVKAGRFVPSYGWKFDDHTMFVRSELGFMPPANSDAGIELGASPGRSDIQIDVLNGNRGSIQDNDSHLATSVNANYRIHVGPLGAAAGISGYDDTGSGTLQKSWGAYGDLTWKRLTWLGELDLFDLQPAGLPSTTGVVTSHELSVQIRQGVDALATYDFYDPDRWSQTGAKTRWGGGVSVMPRSFAVLQALLRRTTFENGISYSGRDTYESVVQVHLLY